MDLDPEWKQRVGEKLFQEGDQKEEGKFLPNKILTMIKFTSLNKSSQFLNILRKKKLDNKYFTIFFILCSRY